LYNGEKHKRRWVIYSTDLDRVVNFLMWLVVLVN